MWDPGETGYPGYPGYPGAFQGWCMCWLCVAYWVLETSQEMERVGEHWNALWL